MDNTISDGLATVILPIDLVWKNEFTTTQIAQTLQRGLNGSFIVTEAEKLKGRSIQLTSDINSGWITRLDLLALRALSEQEDQPMVLVYNTVSYDVIFDRSKNNTIKATQVIDCSNPTDEDFYSLSVSFLTITP